MLERRRHGAHSGAEQAHQPDVVVALVREVEERAPELRERLDEPETRIRWEMVKLVSMQRRRNELRFSDEASVIV